MMQLVSAQRTRRNPGEVVCTTTESLSVWGLTYAESEKPLYNPIMTDLQTRAFPNFNEQARE